MPKRKSLVGFLKNAQQESHKNVCWPTWWPVRLSFEDRRIYSKDLRGDKAGDPRLLRPTVVQTKHLPFLLLKQTSLGVLRQIQAEQGNTPVKPLIFGHVRRAKHIPPRHLPFPQRKCGHARAFPSYPCSQMHSFFIVHASLCKRPPYRKNILHSASSIVHGKFTVHTAPTGVSRIKHGSCFRVRESDFTDRPIKAILFNILKSFLSAWVFCMYLYMCTMCIPSVGVRRGPLSPGTGITNSCEPLYRVLHKKNEWAIFPALKASFDDRHLVYPLNLTWE